MSETEGDKDDSDIKERCKQAERKNQERYKIYK